MRNLDCQRLFDINGATYTGWPALLIGAAAIVIGVVIAWRVRSYGFVWRWLLLAFAAVWFAIEVSGFVGFKRLQAAVRRGEYESVEGLITEYHPVAAGRTGNEWFIVGGHRFEFSDASLDPGYKKTRRRGGILKTGDYVRVAYRKDAIMLLDRCEPHR